MPQGDIPSINAEHHLPFQLRPADLRRHEVPRKQEADPQRSRGEKHSRLLKKSCQSFGFRVVESPWSRQGLLPDQLQRQP